MEKLNLILILKHSVAFHSHLFQTVQIVLQFSSLASLNLGLPETLSWRESLRIELGLSLCLDGQTR